MGRRISASLNDDNLNLQNQKAEDEASLADENARLNALHVDVCALIVAARQRVGLYVNQELTLLYWDVGRQIRTEVLREQRADYGEQIVRMLSRSLVAEFGHGFGRANLFNMLRFAELFPDRSIVQTLSG